MRGDAASRLVGYKIGDVLVTVVKVEEVVCTGNALHPERPRRDRLRRIPPEGEFNRVVCGGVQALNAKVTIIDETLVGIGRGRDGTRPARAIGHRFEILNTAAHAVVLHRDVRRAARPQDGAVLAVVGDAPDASGGLYERLVSVQVELRSELFLRRVGDNAPYQRVLVEAIGDVCAVGAEVERREAVADVVVLVGVFGRRRQQPSRFGGENQLVADVVAVNISSGLGHRGAGAGDFDTATCRIIGVTVLGDYICREGITDLQKLVVRIVCPRCSEPIGIRERRFEVAAIEIVPFKIVGVLSWSWRMVVCNFHCGDSAFIRLVTDRCLTHVIQSVARRTSEFIPITFNSICSRDTDYSFVGE